jgi:general secretion pathway protein J
MKASQGFTLIEVLVASAILSLMALLSWRSLDGMAKAQSALQERSNANQTLQVGLAQWRTDLDSMMVLPNTPALDWDGRVLRITRQHSQDPQAGVQVVAWTLANGQWTRWQSAPLTQSDAWAQAWKNAQVWSESAGRLNTNTASEVLIHPVRDWQIYFHREGAWGNALSSDGARSDLAKSPNLASAANATNATNAKLPEGIRLVIDLANDSRLQGKLSIDWVRPTFTAVKQ